MSLIRSGLMVLTAGILGLAVSENRAFAQCVNGSGTITCTGSANGTSISNTGAAAVAAGANLVVSGAPAGSTVTGVTVVVHGYTAIGNNNTTEIDANCPVAGGLCRNSRDMGMLLAAPGLKALQLMRDHGTIVSSGTPTHQTNVQLTFADSASSFLPKYGTLWNPSVNGSETWKPTSYDGTFNGKSSASPSYLSAGGPASFSVPGSLDNPAGATLASAFAGATVNGGWTLYIASDSNQVGSTVGAKISFTSFDLVITYSAASTPSTTVLASSSTTPFTSGQNSSITLTATVTSGATGSVTFKDGVNNLTCSGGNPAPISSNSATCITALTTEGVHNLSAVYGGNSTFVGSTGTANVFAMNHATNANGGTTYCNTGQITGHGNSNSTATTSPYPSVIYVGDGVNTNIAGSVDTVSVQLTGLSGNSGATPAFLLVSPDGSRNLEFWTNNGVFSPGNYIMQDGSPQLAQSPVTGTFSPTSYTSDSFAPSAVAPAPAVPASITHASPAGSGTFLSSFVGTAASGAWKLYMYDIGGAAVPSALTGGWCITITPATGLATNTTVVTNPANYATAGTSTSFNATVTSSQAVNKGTVTFTENGAPLTGAPNSGVANVINGAASIATSGLPEGDHTITATYHDSTGAFNDSIGTVSIRIDNATATPTLSVNTWSYCNTGAITIPAGQLSINNHGPATPNPSNIFVTNLPGTINSVTLTLKNYALHVPNIVEALLVGPNGASLPAAAQTFDFLSNAGGISSIGPQTTTVADAFAAASSTSAFPGTVGPASYGAVSYTASPFYTLPGSYNRATTAGTSTFGSVYGSKNPIGTWSLYFNQNTSDVGSGVNNGWCLNFIQNPITGTGTMSHTGPAPSNHFKQGQAGTITLTLLNNGNGPSGDPDGNHGLVATGTLPTGLSFGTLPTGCTAVAQVLTCRSSAAVAQGSSYVFNIPVVAAANAPASVTTSGFTFSGAGFTSGSFAADSITIDPAPVLAITKTHTGTFTQGGSGQWNLIVSNTSPTAAGSTNGSTVTVTDLMPTGYTVQQVATGNEWNCTASTSQVNCTTTSVLAGAGATYSTIVVTVAIPANSATSVTNTASVFGGGDLTHTNSGTAATGSDTVTVVQVPASISLTTGNNQTVTVNTAYPTALTVTVLDAGNVVIPGVNVTFTAPASGASGTFPGGTNAKTVATNPSGVAAPGTYTANTIAGGPYNISVQAGSITNNLSETNIAGAPSQFTANAGSTPQSANVTTQFANPLAVTVKDAFNNPVSGLSVTFTAPGSGASGIFSNSTTSISLITNASGVASATITANGTAGGPYSVTAAASGLNTSFSLTNTQAPTITGNPLTTTVCSGSSAGFSASASGTPAPTVQWFVSTDSGATFNPVAGATSTTLNLGVVTVSFEGNQYKAVFTNSGGTATTNVVTLHVITAPTVTAPAPQTVSAGSTATFTSTVGGSTGTIKWQVSTDNVNFTDIPSSASATLAFTAQATDNGKFYRIVVTNTCGTATSVAAQLTVTAGPSITGQPVSTTVCAGTTVGFSTSATGTPTPTVQWYLSTDNGVTFNAIPSATSSTLSLGATTAAMSGNKYKATWTNSTGSVTTNIVTLTVNTAPTVTAPAPQSVAAGSTASFSSTVGGSTGTIKWQVSTDNVTYTDIPGSSSATLAFTAQLTDNGKFYRIVVTNTCGTATSVGAQLTVTAGPVITQNPTDQTVNAGQTATFTAAATGTPTPTVQWQFSNDGGATYQNVAGATTTTLTVPNVSAGQNGQKFRAVFTNASGTANTSAATLTVNFAPTVTTNPVSQSVSASSLASFTAAANGNPTPTVQWQQSTNGGATFTNIAGATSTTLSFTAQVSQNGNQYRAVFTNSVGSATSTAATLTVTAGPVITQNPTDQTVNASQTATFTAAATGTPTPTVQWQFSNDGGATYQNVAGATTTTLTVPNVSAGQNGQKFRAVFTNSTGTANTTAATLTVNFAPTVTTNPVSQSVSGGSSASFTASANGNPTPTVQWQQSTDGGATFTNIAGATSTTLTFTAQTSQNGNQYRAVFTNSVGSATSAAATLTVTAGPVITQNPTDQTVNASQTATFTAAATGTPTPTVQWQFSNDGGATYQNVAGATTTTLTVPNVSAGQNGQKFRAVFTNSTGTATTTAATLTVNFAPTVTTNPVSQTITAGSNVSFTAAANGNPTPTVQWQQSTDGGATFTNIAGATSTTLSFTTQLSQSGNQYRAVFTNSVGSATSTAATLTVNAGPVVTLNPVNQTVSALTNASFTAAATGTPTPTVQWQVSTNNGVTFTNLSGATSTTLSLTGVTGSMTGNQYRAVFTNAAGSATTTAATLTVNKLATNITWSNPADILFGGALGSGQLNATANVPGTFVYTPPFGTVLPLGDGQTLSVAFTPTDTVNYSNSNASVLINVKAPVTGGTPANLVVTNVLSRDPDTGDIIATLTIANSGGTDATNVTLTTATLGSNPTSTVLPVNAGKVAADGQAVVVVRFPGSTGAAGTRSVLGTAGVYDGGGSFGGNVRVTLP